MGCTAVIISHIAAVVVLPVIGVAVGIVQGHTLISAFNREQSVISCRIPGQGI